MGWRILVISSPAKLRIQDSQLVVCQDQDIPVPLEDVSVLMLESQEVLLSSALLSRCAEEGVLVLTCDGSHLPTCAALPFAGHSRLSGVHRMQLGTSLPFRKRCWQSIVKRKIANQAECLRLLNRPGEERLKAMVGDVGSGDPMNVEARAAREYFRFLFGPEFIRGAEDTPNSALNYGYAVVRGAVARALVAHGFLPSQGIHHRSELNAFNLADDFIEPLRPVVDLCAAGEIPGDDDFQKEHRQLLATLLGRNMLMDGQAHSVLRAADMMAASFASACKENDPGELKLPELLLSSQHSYE